MVSAPVCGVSTLTGPFSAGGGSPFPSQGSAVGATAIRPPPAASRAGEATPGTVRRSRPSTCIARPPVTSHLQGMGSDTQSGGKISSYLTHEKACKRQSAARPVTRVPPTRKLNVPRLTTRGSSSAAVSTRAGLQAPQMSGRPIQSARLRPSTRGPPQAGAVLAEKDRCLPVARERMYVRAHCGVRVFGARAVQARYGPSWAKA
jgi:hypothetical protein